jgi:hypothetical protein
LLASFVVTLPKPSLRHKTADRGTDRGRDDNHRQMPDSLRRRERFLVEAAAIAKNTNPTRSPTG